MKTASVQSVVYLFWFFFRWVGRIRLVRAGPGAHCDPSARWVLFHGDDLVLVYKWN